MGFGDVVELFNVTHTNRTSNNKTIISRMEKKYTVVWACSGY